MNSTSTISAPPVVPVAQWSNSVTGDVLIGLTLTSFIVISFGIIYMNRKCMFLQCCCCCPCAGEANIGSGGGGGGSQSSVWQQRGAMSEVAAGVGNASSTNGCQACKVLINEPLPCISVVIIQPDDEVVCGTPTTAG
jgi:hypothetical protein